MSDRRLVLKVFGGAAAVGLVIGATPTISRSASDLMRGLITEQAVPEVSPDAALPALQKPLSAEEQHELMQGMEYFLAANYSGAAQILGKYAMLGEPSAQAAMGSLYYFGKGVPLNRSEGVSWLRLAAAQGLSGGQEALSAAMNGTWQWSNAGGPSTEPLSSATAVGSAGQFEQFATGDGSVVALLRNGLPRPSPSDGPMFTSAPYSSTGGDSFHARVEQELYGGGSPQSYSSTVSPMSRDATTVPPNVGTINTATGQYMTPAGPGGYVDPANGTFYAPSGPDGVVNTRTGEYSPVSH